MNRQKIIDAYTTLRDYPAGIKPSGYARLIRSTWNNALPHIKKRVMGYLNADKEISDRYPEIRDSEYLVPAAYTALIISAAKDPEWFVRTIDEITELSGLESGHTVAEILGSHFPWMMLSKYFKLKNVTRYAVSETVLNKAADLGDPLDIPIDDLVGRITGPRAFFVDNGDIYVVFKTPYYNTDTGGYREVLRIELLGGGMGSTFFDIHKKLDSFVTLRDLYDYYREQQLELVPESTPGIAMQETSRILPLLLLTLADNIRVPRASEFNRYRFELTRNGSKGRAKRHESFKFIDLDETKFIPRSTTATASGSSKSPHMRKGHFRRQRFGSRGSTEYRIIWIAPVAVHGGNSDENRVFYVIK